MQTHPSADRGESDHAPVNGGFEVAGWLVRPQLNRMIRGKEAVQVEPKIMQVLVQLALHEGEPVTRDHLLATVWEGTVVTDDVLTRSISELRKIFGDHPREAQVIETIPKVGYRLIAPVQRTPAGDSSPDTASAAEVALSFPSAEADSPPTQTRWIWGGAVLFVGMLAALSWVLLSTSSEIIQPLQPRPLTSFPGREFAAALSPSGDRVAFSWSKDGERGADIYVMPIDGGPPRRLTDHSAFEWNPAWAPDGQTVAFVRRSTERCGVLAVPVLGGPERELAECQGRGFPDVAWSPDGQWLALADRPSSQAAYALYLVSVATGEHRRVTSGDAGHGNDYSPRFSPDGSTLAFVRAEGGNRQDLYVLTLPDGPPRRVTFDDRSISGFDWMPDGRRLVMASNRAGRFGLWKVDLEEGSSEWLPVGQEAMRPTLASQEPHLVYEHWDNDSNIYRLSYPEERAVAIAPSTRMDFFPHLTPDGSRMAFVSNRSGDYEVWTSDADGAHPAQRTFQGFTYALLPRWSPDGQRIAFAAYLDGQADVFVLDELGNAPRRLTSDSSNEAAPTWSRDGRWIYFGSDRSGTWEVWRIPAGGGTPVQVTQAGGYRAQESMDGQTLYFSKRRKAGLWGMPTAGGAERRVLHLPRPSDATNWSVGTDGVYVMDRTRSPEMSVAFFDVDEAAITERRSLGQVMTEGGLFVSDDGGDVFYVRIDQSSADLMLLEGEL